MSRKTDPLYFVVIKVSCLVRCFVLHVGSLRRHGNKNVKNITGGSVAIKSFCGSLIFSHFVLSPSKKFLTKTRNQKNASKSLNLGKINSATRCYRRVVQWWEYSPPTSVARVQILASAPYMGWVCCWFSPLLREVFFSGFPFSSKTNISKFQFDQESDRRRTAMWMCYLQILIYLFVFLLPGVRLRSTSIIDR